MEQLTVAKQSALNAYADAGKKGQTLLENLFGKKVFKGNVRDRIHNFDDVLSEVGISAIDFINLTKNLPKRFVAESQMEMITRAYNEGVEPDWNDSSQTKYYPWFWMNSARGFSYHAYGYGLSYSRVAARLAFLDLDNLKDAVKKFLPIFETYFTEPLTLTLCDAGSSTQSTGNKSLHWKDIVSLEKALEYTGESIQHFNYRTQFDTDQQRAGKELEVIAEAIRQGNELGQEEGDCWYYPWFNAARSARGFSFDGDDHDNSSSLVAARLCVETPEKATFMGKQHIDTYNRYVNG